MANSKHYESNNVVALALQEAVNKCLNNPLDGDKTVKQTTGDVLAWNSLKELGVLKEDE